MTPGLFVLLAALAAGTTLLATLRGRPPFAFTWFVVGWITGELALFHLVAQVAVTVWALAVGAATPVGLGLMALSWAGLLLAQRRAGQAGAVIDAALGPDVPPSDGIDRRLLFRPFHYARPDVEVVRDLHYGPHALNTLDVYRRRDHEGRAPTLVHVHGGSWLHGRKERQAKPLTWHLAGRGWVVVSINYRLSPDARMPDHVEDVKAAVRWVREHADELGADPDFIVLTGGSAGGHLTALAALDPELDVQGCVPHYGLYDLRLPRLRSFLQSKVMPGPPDELWDAMSPIAQVRPDAPPFFILHGAFDSMAYAHEARPFVDALRAVSPTVTYAELPGAQHAFDQFHTVRGLHVADGVTRWLTWLHSGSAPRASRPSTPLAAPTPAPTVPGSRPAPRSPSTPPASTTLR